MQCNNKKMRNGCRGGGKATVASVASDSEIRSPVLTTTPVNVPTLTQLLGQRNARALEKRSRLMR